MKGVELELPPGFRFHPTDDELVNHYLCKKCAGKPISASIIAEINLYMFDPWELPEMARYGEKEWYFFSPRDRKYPNGSRPNRAAGTGYWKATGADKPIGRPKTLGIKKALVFYSGKAPKGIKTNWIMHEYRLANVDRSASNKKNQRLDDWVLCRIYNKKGTLEKHCSIDKKIAKFPEMEDKKPNVLMSGQNGLMSYGQANLSRSDNKLVHMDMSDSIHRLQTDTSCSEHVLSLEEEEDEVVQSQPTWNELELHNALDFNYNFNFNFNTDGFQDDPAIFQMDQIQDMFSDWQKPLF